MTREMTLGDIVEEAISSKETEKYVDAPEVEALAKKLIKKFQLSDAEEAVIKFLFYRAEKSSFFGKCSRATGKWSYLTGYDYVIEVWEPFWSRVSDHAKEALIYHELLHIQKQVTTKGKVKWILRKHDVEEFLDVVREYGPWSDNLQSLKELVVGDS
ncbi:MAG: hypothetical protein J7J46_05540 [Candidatus Desulfofervidus sp.]|nr:hypothetical protein [Candidatus Desulfofervidus sp.]